MGKDTARNRALPTIELFRQYDGGNFPQWAENSSKDIEFVNNTQWEIPIAQALEANNQPVVVNNEIKPARDQVVGQLTENAPRWIASPREDSDTKLAGYMSDFMSYIWDNSKGNMHFRKYVEDFEDIGLGVFHVYYDPNDDMGKGEIRIVRIDPQKWRCDPKATWRNAQDADNQFLTDVLSEDKIKLLYPEFDFNGAVETVGDGKRYNNGANPDGMVFNPSSISDTKYYQIIDRYQRVKVPMFWVYDPNSNFEKVMDRREYIKFSKQPALILVKRGQEKVISDPQEVQQIVQLVNQLGSDTFYQLTDGSYQPGTEDIAKPMDNGQGQIVGPVKGSTIMVKPVSMLDLLNDGSIKWQTVQTDRIKRTLVIGEKLYKEVLMPISNYPFAVAMLHHTDCPYPYGDARITRSIQEQINKINSIIIAYNINISSIRAFIQKDSFDKKDLDERWGKVGTQFFEYDAEAGAPPIVVQLTQMSNSFFAQLDRHRALIQRIYGAYDFQEGQMTSAPYTASGTMQIDEAGMRRSKSKLQILEEALNDLGSTVAEMIPYVYTERKLIHILLPNNSKSKQILFNDEQPDGEVTRIINDLTANRYDIKMISSSTLPTNRAAKFNAYLQLWREKAISNPEPLLRLTDLPNIDEIIETENMIKRAEQQIQQMAETIKELKGDNQTLQRETMYANQQVETEKFKTKLNTYATQAKASVELGKLRVNDKINNFNKEVQIKTNADSKSNGDTSQGVNE